jgi:hypothetical protein
MAGSLKVVQNSAFRIILAGIIIFLLYAGYPALLNKQLMLFEVNLTNFSNNCVIIIYIFQYHWRQVTLSGIYGVKK